MVDPATLGVFLAATLVVNLTPGPSVLYVSSIAAARGRRAGIVSALGLMLGLSCHVVASALGLSILLQESATAFATVKWIGAIYLIVLGLKTLFSSESRARAHRSVRDTTRGLFVRGLFVDLLNPKVALFFLAFLPQFVDARAGVAFEQTLVLGSVFVVSGTIVNVSIAVFVDGAARLLGGRAEPWLKRWIPGGVMVGLGAKLALSEK